jgi:hypothetical protein
MRRIAAVVLLLVGAAASAGWCVFRAVTGEWFVNEIVGAVYLLICVVCVAGLGIIGALDRVTEFLPRLRPPPPRDPTIQRLDPRH